MNMTDYLVQEVYVIRVSLLHERKARTGMATCHSPSFSAGISVYSSKQLLTRGPTRLVDVTGPQE